MDHVDFWFDPLCPYSWITSRWMVERQRHRPVTVLWHPLSLGLLHTAPGVAPDELQELARGPVRVLAAAAEAHGEHVVGPLYTALGQRLHDDGGALTDIRVGFFELRKVTERALPDTSAPVPAGGSRPPSARHGRG
ncbi:DsbA family protein [Frankia sp. AiPs1]|uniref:DsbA family protein n=1 Tax=Frankia sp. AiPs1 TaxID=573493 RepID=UPI002042FAC0|nr:DsbA family protein [Frankia sp. AiPs1]MCM3920975.1 DsbA family protein [Frankia sp. AiPs1]